jgi:hypothetical protein
VDGGELKGTWEGKPAYFTRLPWGHWCYYQYRKPSATNTAIGAWILFGPTNGISLSIALIAVSFVFGYRWSEVVLTQIPESPR